MPEFLMLKLAGVMQAWGGHTYEDYRPSYNFPTRSGIEGLLAACLGIDRDDHTEQTALANSFSYAVRADHDTERTYQMRKISDFHTIMEARKVDGKANPNPVISRREYLCDQAFTLALAFKPEATYSLGNIVNAVKKPHYTPFLGRRSCPLTKPLFIGVQEAETIKAALDAVAPGHGTIYTAELSSQNRIDIRDYRDFTGKRRFNKRQLYIHGGDS